MGDNAVTRPPGLVSHSPGLPFCTRRTGIRFATTTSRSLAARFAPLREDEADFDPARLGVFRDVAVFFATP
tara:strand:+ start:163 stop:375 length:213 start_codon:yes stop_codon:yes gene_type:complete